MAKNPNAAKTEYDAAVKDLKKFCEDQTDLEAYILDDEYPIRVQFLPSSQMTLFGNENVDENGEVNDLTVTVGLSSAVRSTLKFKMDSKLLKKLIKLAENVGRLYYQAFREQEGIKIIKGSYGMRVKQSIVAVPAGSDPIELSKEKEERLVRLGVAVYVTEQDDEVEQPGEGSDETQDDEIVDEFPEYNEEMKLSELKDIAKVYGIDASSMRSKKEVIEAIDAARDELPDVDADALVE